MVCDARARLGFAPTVTDLTDVGRGDFPVSERADFPDDRPADRALCELGPVDCVRSEDTGNAFPDRD